MKKTLAILLISLQAMAGIGPFPGGSSGGGGGGSGTVTSVSLALPSIFTVSGSPVTSSGTLTGTLATQAANIVFAGPTGGGAATPTFRSLVASDIPSLSYVNTVGAFSASSQTNGASISTNTITFGPADTTNPGMVSTGSQTVTGNKIFIGPLSAGASSQFNVNTGGNITKINNVATNWPSAQGSANTYLKNDGNGTLSWATVSAGSGDVVGPSSSVDGNIATFNGITGKLIRSESKFSVNATTGAITKTFAGGPTTLDSMDIGTATTWTQARLVTGTSNNTPSTGYIDRYNFTFDVGSTNRSFYISSVAPTINGTTSALIAREYTSLLATSSGASAGGQFASLTGVVGNFSATYNLSTTGLGIAHYGWMNANKAIGARGLAYAGQGSAGRAVGVNGVATTENNPSIVAAGYFPLDSTISDGGAETDTAFPAVSGALVTTNGDTALDIFVARDGTTTTFSVIDGGVTQIGATGGSAIHRINGATEAAGAQSLTLTNGPTAVTSANPTVYLKIRINDVTYVIPAWPVP